jgi:hypothetical protein
LSFILGARIGHVPYPVDEWRREHPGEDIPDADRMGIGPGGDATPRCARWNGPGPGRRGSSSQTSPTASAVLDHDIMVEILAEKIRDNRFLRLIRNMLQAGYLGDWRWNAALSGAPQGGVVSPCSIQDLFAQVGRVRGNSSDPATYPRNQQSLFDLAHSLYKAKLDNALFLRADRRPDAQRTFKLLPGEPLPTSYGQDLYQGIFELPAQPIAPARRPTSNPQCRECQS